MTLPSGINDFDFLMGTWQIYSRRLRERLKGSTVWEEIAGRMTARKTLGGLGNMDEVTFERDQGPLLGMTVRFYNPATRQWSIYWADSVNGFSPVPMVGEFKEGRGEFYDQETFEGRSIYVRFIWSGITATSCRWEQAFSTDGGQIWETNWTMDFIREDHNGIPQN